MHELRSYLLERFNRRTELTAGRVCFCVHHRSGYSSLAFPDQAVRPSGGVPVTTRRDGFARAALSPGAPFATI